MPELELSDLLSTIRRTVSTVVAREIRHAGMLAESTPVLPLPCDVEAENEVLSALLCGYVRPADLAPLEAEHFFSRFAAEVFAALVATTDRGTEVRLDLVAIELHDRGVRGPVAAELLMIQDAQPFCALDRLRQRVVRLLESWRARRLIALLRTVDVDLRLGRITTDAACRRVREAGEV